jgi:hypothetical protein
MADPWLVEEAVAEGVETGGVGYSTVVYSFR